MECAYLIQKYYSSEFIWEKKRFFFHFLFSHNYRFIFFRGEHRMLCENVCIVVTNNQCFSILRRSIYASFVQKHQLMINNDGTKLLLAMTLTVTDWFNWLIWCIKWYSIVMLKYTYFFCIHIRILLIKMIESLRFSTCSKWFIPEKCGHVQFLIDKSISIVILFS